MDNHYDVTTLESELPSEHFKECHALALDLVGFRSVVEGFNVYLYTPVEVGTSHLEIDEYDDASFDEAWASMLEESGLAPYAAEDFVINLRNRFHRRSWIPWHDVVQTVLADMPPGAVPHLDFQGAYWCEKERPTSFSGFALRISRDNVVVQEHAQDFFVRVDKEQAWSSRLRALPPEQRIDAVVDAVLGHVAQDQRLALGQAMRLAFPEASRFNEVSPEAAKPAVDGLKALLSDWVATYMPTAEDEPEAPRP